MSESPACPHAAPLHTLAHRQDQVVAPALERELRALRHRHGPVFRATFPVGGDGWLAVGYDEVKAVMADPRFGVWAHREGDHPRVRDNEGRRPPFPVSFVLMDPPHHTRRRRALTKHFSVTRVRDLRPATERTVAAHLDRLEEAGPGVDLVPEFVQRIPVAVACELFGVPDSDRHRFLPAAMDLINGRSTDPTVNDQLIESINTYFGELLDARRAAPGDDLISALAHDPVVTEVWSEEELRGVGFVLLFAGHDATSAILGGALQWLVHSPDLYALVRERRDDLRTVVEEFLRVLPAGIGTRSRIANEDVELGGVVIRAGEAVIPLVHTANFDERVFDEPQEIRFDGSRGPNVRFGHGIHACLGQQLARMEIEVALRALVDRFPRLSPVEPDEHWREKTLLRGPKSVRVTW